MLQEIIVDFSSFMDRSTFYEIQLPEGYKLQRHTVAPAATEFYQTFNYLYVAEDCIKQNPSQMSLVCNLIIGYCLYLPSIERLAISDESQSREKFPFFEKTANSPFQLAKLFLFHDTLFVVRSCKNDQDSNNDLTAWQSVGRTEL